MTGNGRGTMRPQGRSPPFLLIGLLVALCILGYSYWNISSQSHEQASRVARLQDEVRMLSTRNLEGNKHAELASNRLADFEKQVTSLRTSLKEKTNEVNKKSEELQSSLAELESKHNKLVDCENEKDRLQEQVTKLEGEKASLEQQLKDKPDQCDEDACTESIKNVLSVVVKRIGPKAVAQSLEAGSIDPGKYISPDVQMLPGQGAQGPQAFPQQLGPGQLGGLNPLAQVLKGQQPQNQGQQNNVADPGQQNNVAGQGQQNIVADPGQQNNVADPGQQNNVADQGQQNNIADPGQQNNANVAQQNNANLPQQNNANLPQQNNANLPLQNNGDQAQQNNGDQAQQNNGDQAQQKNPTEQNKGSNENAQGQNQIGQVQPPHQAGAQDPNEDNAGDSVATTTVVAPVKSVTKDDGKKGQQEERIQDKTTTTKMAVADVAGDQKDKFPTTKSGIKPASGDSVATTTVVAPVKSVTKDDGKKGQQEERIQDKTTTTKMAVADVAGDQKDKFPTTKSGIKPASGELVDTDHEDVDNDGRLKFEPHDLRKEAGIEIEKDEDAIDRMNDNMALNDRKPVEDSLPIRPQYRRL